MECINSNILCRSEQFSILSNLIKEGSSWLPTSIFLYGVPGTGKSVVISRVLEYRTVETCYANCIEFYSPRVIYESLLDQLAGVDPNALNNYGSYASCDNFATFSGLVKEICTNKNKRYAIVFEQSERLRDYDINIFPSFCRLQEICSKVNICVIFTSRVPLELYRPAIGIFNPIVVNFPQYSKGEILKILFNSRPTSTISDSCYMNYINSLLMVFYSATKNLPELKYLAELNFNSYCEPILEGLVKEDDVQTLWNTIEPKLKSALSTVYLREVSSEQFQKMQEITDLDSKDMISKKSSTVKMELPFFSKYLLISSYLASYNPPKTDKRFFTKNHGKKRKTAATMKAQQKCSSQLLGPKAFALDRMLAIFYSIIEDKVAPTSHIFSQISSLVSLRLMTFLGSEDSLASPKYKTNVSLDFIRSIARTVNFDIVQYLYEFASN